MSATGVAELDSKGWEAVGFFDGTRFGGISRQVSGDGRPMTNDYRWLYYELQPDGSIAAIFLRADARGGKVLERWTREPFKSRPAAAAEPVAAAPPVAVADEELPKFGEYVHVEELPEAIHKVEAVYPDSAREAGVDGTVMVQALVGTDGGVKDTRIVKSIPMLDQAAIQAVRQWTFKPALDQGKPVAVWIAVPMQFPMPGGAAVSH